MRIQAIPQIIVLFLSGAVAAGAAELDRSQCHTVPAHHTVTVTSGGASANPSGISGGPSQPGCQVAYVVDFVSPERRMSSFVPDRDWVKGTIPLTSCLGECRDVEYTKFRAGIHVFRCTTPHDCKSHKYSKVGAYSVRYGKAILPPRCAALLNPGQSVPTVRDSYGVRVVVMYEIVNYVDFGGPQCEKAPLPMPPALGFNVSGTAGFPTVDKVDEGTRPKAVPVPGGGDSKQRVNRPDGDG